MVGQTCRKNIYFRTYYREHTLGLIYLVVLSLLCLPSFVFSGTVYAVTVVIRDAAFDHVEKRGPL